MTFWHLKIRLSIVKVNPMATPKNISAQNLISIESLINSHDSRLQILTKESRSHQEMLNSLLDNDPEYSKIAKEAAKITKLKSVAKSSVLQRPEAKSVAEKLQDNRAQIKELKIALSDYMSQYVALSGSNQIEGPDGVLRQIIYTAKLVKKTE